MKRAGRVAIPLLVALTLAGCGGPGTAEPSLTGESAPESTVSVEPTTDEATTVEDPSEDVAETLNYEPGTYPLPVLPEAASEFNEEGAVAFALYAIEVMNYARNHGDTALLREIADPECGVCERFSDGIQAVVDDGLLVKGGLQRLEEPKAEYLTQSDLYKITGDLSISEVKLLDRTGEVRQEAGAEHVFVAIVARVHEGEWRFHMGSTWEADK